MVEYYLLPLFSIFAIILKFTKYNRFIFFPLIVLLYSIFFGFRFNSDPDYSEYFRFVELSRSVSIDDYLFSIHVEPVFYFLSKFFETNIFFIVAAISFVTLAYICHKLSDLYKFELFVLVLSCVGYVAFFIQMRWGFALVFLICGAFISSSRNVLKSSLFYFIASMMHFFSFFFLGLFAIQKFIDFRRKMYLVFLIIVLGVYFNFAVILVDLVLALPFVPDYLSYKLDAYVYLFKNKEYFFYFYIIKYMFFWYLLNFANSRYEKIASCYVLLCIIFALFIDMGVFVQRISIFIEVLLSILFVDAIRTKVVNDHNDAEQINIARFIILLFIMFNFLFNMSLIEYKEYLFEYSTILL